MGGVENDPESIEIESIANALPIIRKEIAATKEGCGALQATDQRRSISWIDLRTRREASSCSRHKLLCERHAQVPAQTGVTSSRSTPKADRCCQRESGSEVFKVDYLTATPIWHKALSSTSRWPWLQALSASSRPGPVFTPRLAKAALPTEFSGFDLEAQLHHFL